MHEIYTFALSVVTQAWHGFSIGAALSGFGTLASTFMGAWIAFKFAGLKTEREREVSEIAAGNRALFTLSAMWNEIKQRQKEIVDPYRGKHDAWLNLHMSQPMNENLSFDMKDMSFVMEANAPLFQKIFLEEERHRLAVHLIEEHRRLIQHDAWPKMEAAGLSIGDNRTSVEIQNIIGAGTAQQMRVISEAIITNFDENERSLRIAFSALRMEMKNIYPKHKFIQINFPE